MRSISFCASVKRYNYYSLGQAVSNQPARAGQGIQAEGIIEHRDTRREISAVPFVVDCTLALLLSRAQCECASSRIDLHVMIIRRR